MLLSPPVLAAVLAALSTPSAAAPAPPAQPPAAEDEGGPVSPLAEVLTKHALISRLTYELDFEPEGFILHIQHPRDGSPGHIATVSRIHGRAFGSMGRNMRGMLFDPLGVSEDLVQNVFVCSSEAAYTNAQRYGNPAGRNLEFATTLTDLGLVVTYLGTDGVENPDAMYAALHEAATHLLKAARPGREPIQDLWLFEGLATYFANSGARRLPPGLTPPPEPGVLAAMNAIFADPDGPKALLLSTRELLECKEADRIRAPYLRHASDNEVSFPSNDQSTSAFRAHSALLVQYLLHGEGARYRDGFRDYVKLAFENKGGADALASSIGAEDLDRFDEGFRVFLERATAGGALDSLSEAMTRALGAEGTQHPSILPHPIDGSDWLAFAIGCARLGDLSTALLALEAGTQAASGDMLERMQRAQLRMGALRSTRDAYVESLVGTKTRLRVKVAGERLSAVVTSVADGVVQLGKNDQEWTQLELRKILPADIAENLGRHAAEFGPAWTLCYGLLLGDSRRWDKDLDEEDADAKTLAADAGSEMRDLMEAGDAMARLAELARMPAPEGAEDAQALNAAITSLLEDCGELDAVRLRFEPLRNLSALAWTKLYEEQGLSAVLHGDVETLEDGRIRVKYNFKDKDQLEDFQDRGDYLADHRTFEGKEPSLKIQKKALVGDGALCYEHLLGFEAPLTVKYTIQYGKTKKKNKDAQSNFIMGICDDGHESYVIAYNMFDLEAVDKQSKHVATVSAEGERKIDIKKDHELELDHDGESTVTFTHRGKEVETIDTGKRKAGSVFFWMNTQVPISILEFEIEGKVIDSALVRMQNEWVARQLDEMGFGG
ncbi:MAG: acylphosphatase [Chlamydiales bacterium]|jgi:acylphosphatase